MKHSLSAFQVNPKQFHLIFAYMVFTLSISVFYLFCVILSLPELTLLLQSDQQFLFWMGIFLTGLLGIASVICFFFSFFSYQFFLKLKRYHTNSTKNQGKRALMQKIIYSQPFSLLFSLLWGTFLGFLTTYLLFFCFHTLLHLPRINAIDAISNQVLFNILMYFVLLLFLLVIHHLLSQKQSNILSKFPSQKTVSFFLTLFAFFCLSTSTIILSVGIALFTSYQRSSKYFAPYDVTVLQCFSVTEENSFYEDIPLSKLDLPYKTFTKEFQISSYYVNHDLSFENIMHDDHKQSKNPILEYYRAIPPAMISLSDYNRLMRMQNQLPLTLTEEQFAINCNREELKDPINRFLQEDGTLLYEENTLKAAHSSVRTFSLDTAKEQNTPAVLILPDSLLKGTELEYQIMTINYLYPKDQAENSFYESIQNSPLTIVYTTKQQVLSDLFSSQAINISLLYNVGLSFLFLSGLLLCLKLLFDFSAYYLSLSFFYSSNN